MTTNPQPTKGTDFMKSLPSGDYCILELFGHITLVGRYREVEMIGTKMLAIEPLFCDELLPVVFHGGASVYRLTPCEAETARKYQPREIRTNVPVALLPSPRDYLVKPTGEEDDGQDEILF